MKRNSAYEIKSQTSSYVINFNLDEPTLTSSSGTVWEEDPTIPDDDKFEWRRDFYRNLHQYGFKEKVVLYAFHGYDDKDVTLIFYKNATKHHYEEDNWNEELTISGRCTPYKLLCNLEFIKDGKIIYIHNIPKNVIFHKVESNGKSMKFKELLLSTYKDDIKVYQRENQEDIVDSNYQNGHYSDKYGNKKNGEIWSDDENNLYKEYE